MMGTKITPQVQRYKQCHTSYQVTVMTLTIHGQENNYNSWKPQIITTHGLYSL